MSSLTEKDFDQIADLAARGFNNTEIAERLGTSRTTVLRALKKLGHTVVRAQQKAIEDKIVDMDADDAIDFLLAQLTYQADILASAEQHPVESWDVRLTPAELAILIELYNAEGRTMSRQALLAAYMFGRVVDEEPSEKIIDVYVSKIRQKLPAIYGTIRTDWGYGYKFEMALDHLGVSADGGAHV